MDNEDSDGFRQFRSILHDAQTERNDFGRQEEINDVGVVILLDEGANDAEGSEAEILERSSFGSCV